MTIEILFQAVSDSKIVHLHHAAAETLHEERGIGTRDRGKTDTEWGIEFVFFRSLGPKNTRVAEEQSIVHIYSICGRGSPLDQHFPDIVQ